MITRRELRVLYNIYQQCIEIHAHSQKGLGFPAGAGYDSLNTGENLEAKMVKLYHEWREAATTANTESLKSDSRGVRISVNVTALNTAFEQLSKAISLYTHHLYNALHNPPVIKVTPQTHTVKGGNARIIVDDVELQGTFEVTTPGYNLIPQGYPSEDERQKLIKEKLQDLQRVQEEAAKVLLGINARAKGYTVDSPALQNALTSQRYLKTFRQIHQVIQDQMPWPEDPTVTVQGCGHCFKPVCYWCRECHECRDKELVNG